MQAKKKLSGAELIAQLGSSAIGRAPAPEPVPAAKVGRAAKVDGKAVPLTVRFSEDQVATLRKIAANKTAANNGAVTYTPQDIVRAVVTHALRDPSILDAVVRGVS